MNLKKEEVQDIVSIFYQMSFKTFYINSEDGLSFVKPKGVFVSLGITTSIPSLRMLCRAINSSGKGLNASIAEIKIQQVSGQYMNTVNKVLNDDNADSGQYPVGNIPKNCFNREDFLKYVEENNTDKSTYMSAFESLENGKKCDWNGCMIQLDETTKKFRVFHKYINYMKDKKTGIEYRIGIYVTKD